MFRLAFFWISLLFGHLTGKHNQKTHGKGGSGTRQRKRPKHGLSQAQEDTLKRVIGDDIPDDPMLARENLYDSYDPQLHGDIPDDDLIDISDTLAEMGKPPDPFVATGLDPNKPLGQFDNTYRANEWAGNLYGDHMRSLSDEQKRRIGDYKRDGYIRTNAQLRKAGGVFDDLPQDVKGAIVPIDEAFADAPTTDRDIALMRRGLPPAVKDAFANYQEAGLVGKEFGDDAYGSTTMNPEWISGAVGGAGKAHLLLPKGNKVLPIDGMANLKGAPENELLLPRGTRYRITNVRRDERNQPVIEAEIIG